MRIPVDDPTDPRLSPFLGLRDHRARQLRERPGGDMAGHFIGEGNLVIARAMAAGLPPDSVLVDARRPDAVEVPDHVPVLLASPEVLSEVTGRDRFREPIGCFARPPVAAMGAVLTRHRRVVVTEGVTNPTNMGALVRNAAGLGAGALLLDPTSCDPLYRRAVRVSMGQIFAIEHRRLEPFPAGLGPLHDAGFTTVALTPSGSLDLRDVPLGDEERVAILVGAEGPGLTSEAMQAVTHRVRLPMAAAVDSLNVATAAAIALWAAQPPHPHPLPPA